MKFQPGHKKIGGRRAGTPNRAKLIPVHELLAQKGVHPIDEILKIIGQLSPSQQAKIWLQLSEFAFPKMRSVEVEDVTPPAVMPTADEILAIRGISWDEAVEYLNEKTMKELLPQKD